VYGKADDLAMCEIFGARGQDLTYPEMKWWADRMQVCGVNVLIPHSFNPRAPHDTDCPPYFYNGGFEPRFALYRVWADYTSRLSLLLAGGRHVCPVAVLFSGNARQVGAYTTPEDLTSALQDALYDCDWLPFERFEDGVTKIKGNELRLHGERYRALVVPPAEGITFAALEKVRAFFESGGTVIGYGRLPERSLTLGKTAADIARLCEAIWGADARPGKSACRTGRRGGRSYFLAEQPTPEALAAALGERPACRLCCAYFQARPAAGYTRCGASTARARTCSSSPTRTPTTRARRLPRSTRRMLRACPRSGTRCAAR
jgi:hypothetical protein